MKCSNDVCSGSKVNFEAVGKSNANYTTDIRNLGSDPMDLATNEELSGDVATNIDKLGSSSGAQCTMGSEQEVHFRTLVNEERVESVDCVLPKAAAAKVRSRANKGGGIWCEVGYCLWEENDDGFVEVIRQAKEKVWMLTGGSNSASPSVSTNDNEKGNGCLKPDLNSPNPFDVLNVEGEEMGDSGQQPKVSEHVGTESLNVNKKKAQEPSSSKSDH
ncbi:hypothetical protein Tco_1546914 [Tanacetum coccineum]